MSCYGCVCNNCLYNCELFSAYFTPGEIKDVEDVCYCCDECKWFDGDYTKRSQWRKSCEKFRLPAKHKRRLVWRSSAAWHLLLSREGKRIERSL